MEGTIIKALSGFYYVSCGENVYECKARGRFRLDGTSPLVGDKVCFATDSSGKGFIEKPSTARRPVAIAKSQLLELDSM